LVISTLQLIDIADIIRISIRIEYLLLINENLSWWMN